MSQKTTKYTIECKDGLYRLCSRGAVMQTPSGVDVTTHSQPLAELLLKDARRYRGSYTNPKSMLCYHYSTLDCLHLAASGEDVADHYREGIDSDEGVRESWYCALANDAFLIFRQDGPIRQAIAEYFLGVIPQLVDAMPPHVRMAYQVLINNYQSMMLPYYIYIDVLHGEGDMDDNIASFLDDMEEYHLNEFGFSLDRKAMEQHIRNFVFYASLPLELIK